MCALFEQYFSECSSIVSVEDCICHRDDDDGGGVGGGDVVVVVVGGGGWHTLSLLLLLVDVPKCMTMGKHY